MSHEALYRKYRPKTFAELLGQDAVNRTLLNAIANKHLAHAYLFCGPRGTGKTSTARLLAKALNCLSGGPEPCNACANCVDTGAGSNMDVIEIDAASNRGIEDMRTLRDQVRFASVGGRYKVYIIDEAHMLTVEAVNAFLKTLEEPPPQVVFVLATTEAHKILPTVVSRCQRFDFQRIPTPVLLSRLQYVAQAEQIPVSEAALQAIAKRAAGGLRDGLTLLDQVASLSIDGAAVPDELVLRVLGQVRDESLLAMGDAVANGDVVSLWRLTTEYLHAGYDPQTLIRELMQHVRNLMVMQVAPGHAQALEIAETLQGPLQEQAARFSQADLLYCLELLNETADRMRRSGQDQIWLEAGLARLCQRDALVSLLDLQARVEALEAAVGQGGKLPVPVRRAAPAPARPAPAPAAPPPVAAPAVPSTPAAAPAPAATPVPAGEPGFSPAPASTAPAVPSPGVDSAPGPAPAAPTVGSEPPPSPSVEPVTAPAAETAPPAQPAASVAEPVPPAAAEPAPLAQPAPVPAAVDETGAADGDAPEDVEPGMDEDSEAFGPTQPPEHLWGELVEAIRQRHMPTAALLAEAHPVGMDLAAGTFTLAFSQKVHLERFVANPKRLELVQGGIKAIYGHELKLKCIEGEPPPAPVPAPLRREAAAAMAAVAPPAPEAAPSPERPTPAATRPAPPPPDEVDLVAEAAKIFKGKVLQPPA